MSLSKVVLSGKVVRTPEKRFTPNTNVAVAEFAIAVDSPAKPDGTVESHLIKVITWRDLAERVSAELQKGDLVAVDGRLQVNNFTTSDGQRKREAEIDAINVENLTALVANGGSAQMAQTSPAGRGLAKATASAGSRPNKPASGSQSEDLDAIFASDDEIPF